VALSAGARLGPYEVIAQIGKGGMGEVYRARDTKLGRHVAIKVLPDTFAHDPERLARFEREARTLASLNHPNIAAIYGLEEAEDVRALVLELVDGETLADRLRRGPIPLTEALTIAQQIAAALETAHEQSIIHRDLKPANIKVTPAGSVKVLDFGLAKAMSGGTSNVDPADAPTASIAGTRDGVILGTAAYMSPEQARGQAVDKRTDVWAFGCVLYEMLTGRFAFPGGTFSDTIVSILERDADWTVLPATTPATVRQLLVRCLDKNYRDRMRDIGDARIELREALTHAAPARFPRVLARRVPWRWIWGGVAVAGAVLLASRLLGVRPAAPPVVPVRLNLTFEDLTGEGATPVPSPDGKNFVFQAFDASGRRFLWLRPLASDSARPLPGTEEAEQPFWFPDGQWIGFFAQAKLRRISVTGGTPQNIADVPNTPGGFSNGAAANERGDIIFSAANRGPLFHVRQPDGMVRQLTRLDSSRAENSHRYPTFLPDGRRFLFVARSGRRESNALYLGTLDSADMQRIMVVHSNVAYVAAGAGGPGTIVYARDGTLVQQRFDGDNLVGEPIEIVQRVEYAAPSLLARFAASSDGSVLIFRPAGLGRTQLRWFDRKGNPLATLGPPSEYSQPRLSPDGGRVLVSRPDAEAGNRDVWYVETSRGVAARLTTHAANDWWPVWSPDGASILFASDRDGGPFMVTYQKSSMEPGSAESKMLEVQAATGPEAVPADWSSDRRWVALTTGAGGPLMDVWVAPADGDRKPFRLLASPFLENSPRFSPDTRWIAYTSNESGQYEVYARPFDGTPADLGGKIRISTSGGDFAVWRRDGRELFFIGSDLKLYAVRTSDFGRSGTAPRLQTLFTPCQETVLAGLPMRSTPWEHPYDVSPDGQRFLINCLSLSPGRFDVMLNWTRLSQGLGLTRDRE